VEKNKYFIDYFSINSTIPTTSLESFNTTGIQPESNLKLS